MLAPIAAEAMEEAAMGEEAGASTGDSDDSLQQSTVQLVETIDEPLTHDISGKHLPQSCIYCLQSLAFVSLTAGVNCIKHSDY